MKLITLAALLLAPSLYAADLDVSAGISRYVDGQDGFWYQQYFGHQFNFTSLAFSANVHDNFAEYGNAGFGWQAGWDYAGKMSMQSYATSDAGYSTSRHTCLSGCATPDNYQGRGHDQGFVVSPTASYTVGGVTGTLSVGTYLHLNTWSEHITDPSGSSFDVSNSQRWIFGREFGLALRRDRVVLSYQYLDNKSHFCCESLAVSKDIPAAWHATHMLTVGYSF